MSIKYSKDKVVPLDTEDIYPGEQDRSFFLQKALTLIDDAEKVIPP